MRVSLLKPSSSGILGLEMITFVEPLGLECVAGVLEPAGHECQIVDFRLEDGEVGLEKVRRFEPELVGLQCNFTTERFRTRELARRVKEVLPETFLVIGGHDASRDPEWFLDPAVDAVAAGDGEEIAPALAEGVARGRVFDGAPGLILNDGGKPRPTGPAPARRDLDSIPLPARHLVAEYAPNYYINFRKPLALLETARGCPFKCNFCSVWKFHESTFREKSAARVVEELAAIEAPNVFITDDIFWLDVNRGRELAERIKASGIRKYFTVQTRTDIICRHPELVEMWKDCGHLAIFLGVERVDDAGLAAVNKKNKASNNQRAVDILKELGVGFTCNFIVDPAWDRDDFTRLRDWIEENGTYNSGFSILTPLPGTDLWDEAKRDVTTFDWEMYDILHTILPTKLPLEEFYDEYSRLWNHALEVRYKHKSKAKTYVQLGLALLTRQVSMDAVKKGWNMAKELSDPETFLAGHRTSPPELAAG